MTRQINDTETVISKLDKRFDELTIFMGLAQDCMDTSADEPEYLSFWVKHDALRKMRNEIRFKRFTAKAFLSVKKAEATMMGIFL